MTNKLSLLAIVLSVIAIVMVATPKSGGPTASQTPVKESTYDRIMRTRTIRCAYLVWPHYLNRDMNTGKLSGVYYDLMERIGKDWAVKIEWAEEVGAANRFDGFATGRYDLLCSPVGPTPERTNISGFSRSFLYHPFYLYAREGVTRFDNDYSKLNDETVSMMTIDGYVGGTITKELFPKAKLTSLPNLSTDSEVLLSIAMGKVDAAVCDGVAAQEYINNNPGKLKRVVGPPVRYASETLAFPLGEEKLQTKIDTTLTYYLDTGVIEKILNDNGLEVGKVLRVAKPYQE